MSSKTLHFPSPRHLHALYAGRDDNLLHAERALGVKLVSRDAALKIEAPAEPLSRAEALFAFLDEARGQGLTIRTPDFNRITDAFARGEGEQLRELFAEPVVIATNRKTVVPKTLGQKLYLQSILAHPVVFGIGAFMAGAAGCLLSIIYPISPLNSTVFLGKAFAICVLGGLGSVPGAMVGGLALALIESFSALWFGPEYAITVSFVLLIVILAVRPTGLLGKRGFE